MIVVEGCDGTGKSTLVQKILMRYEGIGITVGKLDPEIEVDNRDEMYKTTRPRTYLALCNALRGNAPPQVWDRLYWSELVYAPVMDRETQFSKRERRIIENIMRELTVIHILCRPPLEQVQANAADSHQKAGELVIGPDQIDSIYHRYEMLEHRMPNRIVYDYTDPTPELFNRVDDYINRRKEREW